MPAKVTVKKTGNPKNDKKKPIALQEVKVTTKRLPTYNSQDSLSFGSGKEKMKVAVKDIKNAVKKKTLLGIDTTSNKAISQSGGKYNRMIPELKVGLAIAKKKK